jgi:hypothetical protein
MLIWFPHVEADFEAEVERRVAARLTEARRRYNKNVSTIWVVAACLTLSWIAYLYLSN